MPRVVVVGAGVSGLAAAYRVRQALPGVDLTVLEQQPRPGGNVWTERPDGFTVEYGPNGIFDAKPHALDFCRDLGLADRLIPASEAARKNRYLYVGGRMHKLPASPFALLGTRLLGVGGKLKLLSEPFRGRGNAVPGDETVAAFARRRFGREAAETFVDGLVTGIHGGDPERLGVRAAFPRLPEYEAEAGSVVRGFLRAAKRRRREAEAAGQPKPGPRRMWSFREGLRVMVEAAAAALGPAVRTGVGVRRVERAGPKWAVRGEGHEAWLADAVVLACPAYQQADVLADLDPELAGEIAGIPYSPIAVVVLGYRRQDAPADQDGFGYIAPQRTGRDVLGVQWCTSIYPDRAPPGFVTWRALCGGVNRPDVLTWDDATLLRRVHDELKVTMGVTGEPVFHRIVRWPRAIPQYVVGHLDRVARIEAAAVRHTGLFLGGNCYHGIALGDCAEQAQVLAVRVAAFLGGM